MIVEPVGPPRTNGGPAVRLSEIRMWRIIQVTTLLTLERGLELLEAVAAADGAATAKVLSRQLDIRLGTCYHLLRTMVGSGHLVRRPGGRYDIGPGSAALGRHLQRRAGPPPELAVILTRLHNKTHETSYLSGWLHGNLVLLHYLAGSLTVAPLDAGYTGHMHARAACRAVLAHLPHEQVATMFDGVPLEAMTSRTITNFDELVVNLATVRRLGYALDYEEFVAGVVCVAAPYFAADGTPAGSFTVAVPASRFERRRVRLIAEVREAATIASNLRS